VTYWRDLPSMVTARDGDAAVIKSQLAQRFQDAIDEAAMRLGETDADAYLAGWTRGEWTPADGGGPGDRLAPCILIANDHARLACYDEIATLHPPARGAFAPAQIHREGSQ